MNILKAPIWLTILFALVLAACGPSEVEIKGVPTKVDTAAKTFTVKGTDGKTYDFRLVGGSKADIGEVKEHFDKQKTIEVRYRSGEPPYEVVVAH